MIRCLVFSQQSQFKMFPCLSSLTPATPSFLQAAPQNKAIIENCSKKPKNLLWGLSVLPTVRYLSLFGITDENTL